MDAVPGEVELAPDEPPGPLDAPRVVDHVSPRLGELQPEILDQRGPEPIGLLDRDAVQIVITLDAEPACQPRQVGALGLLRGGRPDEVGHARKRTGNRTRRVPGLL